MGRFTAQAALGERGFQRCHNLDFATSGLLLLATSKEALRAGSVAFSIEGAIQKEYVAVVIGWPSWEQTTIDAAIDAQHDHPFKMTCCNRRDLSTFEASVSDRQDRTTVGTAVSNRTTLSAANATVSNRKGLSIRVTDRRDLSTNASDQIVLSPVDSDVGIPHEGAIDGGGATRGASSLLTSGNDGSSGRPFSCGHAGATPAPAHGNTTTDSVTSRNNNVVDPRVAARWGPSRLPPAPRWVRDSRASQPRASVTVAKVLRRGYNTLGGPLHGAKVTLLQLRRVAGT
jgi:hypothetical protein